MPRLDAPRLAVTPRPMSTTHQLAGGQSTSQIAESSGSRRSRRMRRPGDLEGEPSPWEKRATHHWKRRWVATDSSAEQSPEVSCSTRAELTVAPGNGRRRRLQLLACGVGVSSPALAGAAPYPRVLQGHSRGALAATSGWWVSRSERGVGRLAGRLQGPLGDVEIRLGGSELHQCSAPALPLRRLLRQPADAIPAAPVVVDELRTPRGPRGDLGRRTVWTARGPLRRYREHAANGLGSRQHSRQRGPRPAQAYCVRSGFGLGGRRLALVASATARAIRSASAGQSRLEERAAKARGQRPQ